MSLGGGAVPRPSTIRAWDSYITSINRSDGWINQSIIYYIQKAAHQTTAPHSHVQPIAPRQSSILRSSASSSASAGFQNNERCIHEIREVDSFDGLRLLLLPLNLSVTTQDFDHQERMTILLHSLVATFRLLQKMQKVRRHQGRALISSRLRRGRPWNLNLSQTYKSTFTQPPPSPSSPSPPLLNRESIQALLPLLLSLLTDTITALGTEEEEGARRRGEGDALEATVIAHAILTLGLCNQARALSLSLSPKDPNSATLSQCQQASDKLAALLVPFLSKIAHQHPPPSLSPSPSYSSSPLLTPLSISKKNDSKLNSSSLELDLSMARDLIPKTLLGLAYLQLHPGDEWLDLSMEALLTCMATYSGLTGKQAATALHSYATLGFSPLGLREGFFIELSTIAKEKMDELRPAQLSFLLHAVSRLLQSPSEPSPRLAHWTRCFFDKSHGKLSGFNASMAAKVVSALTLMRSAAWFTLFIGSHSWTLFVLLPLPSHPK